MKVILLKDVKGLGRRYEEKNVSDGHALNFLIPNKMVVSASANSADQIKKLKEKENQKKESHDKKIHESMQKLKGFELVVKTKANEKNHLFAALTKEKISEHLHEKGIEINPEFINLEHPIKEIGAFRIEVKAEGLKETLTLVIETN